MNMLNKIDWEKIKLYHGTTVKNSKKIVSKGFDVIPTNDYNWLGKGAYFAVNNIFLPILFSNKQRIKQSDVPAIIEIDGRFLSDDIKSKILDLTSQPGMNIFHNISNDFMNFLNPYENYQELKNDLIKLEKHFESSPFYNEEIKPNLIPSIDGFLLDVRSKNIAKTKDVEKRTNTSKKNLTNIIFDWFNYKFSCGMEKDVPIKGVMGHFNTGTPIALAPILKKTKIKRGFADYISYLNRTELSIFGYNYYSNDRDNAFWSFPEIFNDTPKPGVHYKIYSDTGPIKQLLSDSFKESKGLGFEIDRQHIEDLYNLLINEEDSNGS